MICLHYIKLGLIGKHLSPDTIFSKMKTQKLSDCFGPAKYTLDRSGLLVIEGLKKGRPNKRLSFHQRGLKIAEAKITRHDKAGDTIFEISRINYLPKREVVRLHTSDLLYGGKYTIELKIPPAKAKAKPSRDWLVCIDEPKAWAGAEVEIK